LLPQQVQLLLDDCSLSTLCYLLRRQGSNLRGDEQAWPKLVGTYHTYNLIDMNGDGIFSDLQQILYKILYVDRLFTIHCLETV
jgi:hypothetical protein